MKAVQALELLNEIRDSVPQEAIPPQLLQRLDVAIANGVEDGPVPPDPGVLADFQPLIEQLRVDAIANAGRAVAVYVFAANQKTHECYFYGIDAANRDFCIRMDPVELLGFISRAQSLYKAVTTG